MVHKRLAHLFKSSSNNSQGNHGDNCNSFSLSKQREQKVTAGTEAAFVAPSVPKFPSWWDAAQAAGGAQHSVRGGGAAAAGKASDALRRAGAIGSVVA